MLEPSFCSISIQAEELPNEDFNLSHTASSSTSTAFNDEIFLSNQSQLKRDSFLCLPHLSSQRISSIGIPIRPYNRLNAPFTSKLNSSNTFDFYSNNIHQRQVTSDSIGQFPTVDSSTDVIPRCPSSCVFSDTYNPMSNTLKATNHQRIVPSTSTGQNKRLSSSFSKFSSNSSYLYPATSARTNDRPSSFTISTVRLPTPTTAAKNNESPFSSNASFLQSNTSGVTNDRRSLSVSKPSSVLFQTSSNAMNHYCPAPSNSSFDPFATAVTQSKLSTSSSKASFLSTSRYDSRFVFPKSNTSTAAPSATAFTAANHQRPVSLSSSLLKSSLNSSFLRSSTSSTSSTSPKNLENPASSCAYSVQESKFAASNSKSHSGEDDDLPLIDFSNDQDDEAQPGLLHWAVVAEVIPVEIGSPSLRNITVTQEDRLHISNVLECADLDRVIIVKFAIDITIRKLKCLRPRTWLNDEVINFYFNMLMSGLHREEGFYSFSSFFFVRLLDPNTGGYLYKNVRRWTNKVDIFSKKKIFFPINIDNTHWTLLLIDLTVKTIFYYDSYRKVGVYASHALRVGLFIYSFYYYYGYYYLY